MKEYLYYFDTLDDYKNNESGLLTPSASYIGGGEENSVFYKRVLKEPKFDPRYLYDDLTTSHNYNASKRVVGIEVVPASHTPNNKARFMSVKNMSLEDPENGCVEGGDSIRWGNSNEVEELATYEEPPKALVSENGVLKEELSTEMMPAGMLLFSDCKEVAEGEPLVYPFLDNLYAIDVNTVEGGEMAAMLGYIPYQFDKSGNKNPLFTQAGSALVEMDGSVNTDILVGKVDYDWETASEISNDVDGNYPAAVVCRKFNAGVSSLHNKWYLPALGELTYVFANIAKINEKISKIGNTNAVPLGMCGSEEYSVEQLGSWLWSSTQHSSNDAWYLGTNGGLVATNSKNTSYDYTRVRAFLQEP